MKTKLTLILLLIWAFTYSQENEASNSKSNETVEQDRFYSSVGGEFIFSFVNTDSQVEQTNLRFSMWFHFHLHWHYDFSKYMGGFVGIGSRNVGYTTDAKSNNIYTDERLTVYNSATQEYELNNSYTIGDKITTVKRRTYTVGVPLGLKIGNLKKNQFLFFGGEIEFPFHYKNKVWVNDKKVSKSKAWFSEQTNPYLLSSFVGFQFANGMNIKFKWYLSNLMNADYKDNKYDINPYEGLQTQIFYVSFGTSLFNAKRTITRIKTLQIR